MCKENLHLKTAEKIKYKPDELLKLRKKIDHYDNIEKLSELNIALTDKKDLAMVIILKNIEEVIEKAIGKISIETKTDQDLLGNNHESNLVDSDNL